jgi:hypothetical protein
MENGPDGDFEMLFYSGWKMVRSRVNLLVTEPHGQTSTWQLKDGLDKSPVADHVLSGAAHQMVDTEDLIFSL